MSTKKVAAQSNRILRYVSFIFSATVVGTFVASLISNRWLLAFVCILTFISFYLPGFLAKNLKVRLPTEFEFIMVAFLYAAFFLGEIQNFYERFWWWDLFLHTVSGLILGFVGFLILYALYKQKRLTLSPWLFSVFSFSFALAIGGIWEIFEFGMDQLGGFNMQNGSLVDTMWDLIVDSIGALIAATLGYFYVKYNRSPIGWFDKLMRRVLSINDVK